MACRCSRHPAAADQAMLSCGIEWQPLLLIRLAAREHAALAGVPYRTPPVWHGQVRARAHDTRQQAGSCPVAKAGHEAEIGSWTRQPQGPPLSAAPASGRAVGVARGKLQLVAAGW